MPYEPPFAPTPETDALCLEIAELVGSFTALPSIGASPQLHRKLRIRTIRSSLMIEGNTLPEEAVTAILDGKRVVGPQREIREVQNATRAYELMDKLDPVSVDDLLHVHKVMMDGLVDEAGSFRSKNAGVFDGSVLVHAGTPARYVPRVMGDLFAWMKDTPLHPLLVSSIFHHEFEFVHPFADGNGRVGRLWHTLILARWRPVLAWLPIESVILDRQQGYYAAFVESQACGRCEPFVEFMLQVVRDALRGFASGATQADQREERALAFFRGRPQATVSDLAEYLGCSKRSAERAVADLKEEGRLVRHGSTRNGHWEVASSTAT